MKIQQKKLSKEFMYITNCRLQREIAIKNTLP